MCAREFSPSRPGLVTFRPGRGSPPPDWSIPLHRLVYTFAGAGSRDPALSQAGRALVAASPRIGNQAWRVSGHGLTANTNAASVADVAVTATKAGLFPSVAAALGIECLVPDDPVALGELWPLLPESIRVPLTADALLPVLMFSPAGWPETTEVRSSRSRRRVPMTRSQMAFILGVLGKVVMTAVPRLEHLAECDGEDRVAIMNMEPQRAKAVTQVHGEVAGLLHHPRPGRSRSHPGQVQPAGTSTRSRSGVAARLPAAIPGGADGRYSAARTRPGSSAGERHARHPIVRLPPGHSLLPEVRARLRNLSAT